MKFQSIAVTLALLIADFSVARPSRLTERIASRALSTRLIIAADSNKVIQVGAVPSNNNRNALDSDSNWAGVVLTSPPTGQTFNTVSGAFTIPTPIGTGTATIWVGIDGDTSRNSILQAGVDLTVSSNGSVSYQAWFEWLPSLSFDFSNFPISAGDTITLIVQATSPTNGTVVLVNDNTGLEVFRFLNAPNSSTALAGQNAEWIVETLSGIPLTNFTNITFISVNAAASMENLGTTGGTIVEIKQNSSIITNVTINSATSFTVTHL